MNKLSRESLFLARMDVDTTDCEPDMLISDDGTIVDYARIQSTYKECLEHGYTLEEAINHIEEVNGS